MEELKRLRKARGLSQAKLAVLADLDPSTVSQIETGARHANMRTLERLAAALGAEVSDLFPLAQAPLLALSDEEASKTYYMKMPAVEFDAVRLKALTKEIDGTALREMLLQEYNAAEHAYKRLQESGASVEDLERAKDDYAEAKKRWTVAFFDDVEMTIAFDKQRDANVVERGDTRPIPLDKAYDQIRGVVQTLAEMR